jgi:outer membrane receptor protein involved in Fe transport
LEVAYARDVNLFDRHEEALSIRFLGGKLDERSSTVVGGAPAEFAGTRGFPDLTANVTLSYRVGPWSAQVQERFIDEVILNRLWVEGIDVDRNTIPSRAWTNLVVGYGGEMAGAGNWRVTLSVQNLFDKDPPIIPSAGDTRFGAQATDPTYDEWGRRYQLGFNMEF